MFPLAYHWCVDCHLQFRVTCSNLLLSINLLPSVCFTCNRCLQSAMQLAFKGRRNKHLIGGNKCILGYTGVMVIFINQSLRSLHLLRRFTIHNILDLSTSLMWFACKMLASVNSIDLFMEPCSLIQRCNLNGEEQRLRHMTTILAMISQMFVIHQ